MRALFLTFIAIASSLCLEAQTFSSKDIKMMKKDFIAARNFSLSIDMDSTMYCHNTYDKFVAWVERTLNYDSFYVHSLIERYKSTFYANNTYFVREGEKQTTFSIKLKVRSVNENAGVNATAFISYQDSLNFAVVDVSIENGRWNSFDNLLLENAEKQRLILQNSIMLYQRSRNLHKNKYARTIKFLIE